MNLPRQRLRGAFLAVFAALTLGASGAAALAAPPKPSGQAKAAHSHANPIDPENMRSMVDANITLVGDACIPGDMPKSGFSANSQAKVAAMMIRGELASGRTFPARYTNACWSLIVGTSPKPIARSTAIGYPMCTRRSSPSWSSFGNS